MNVGYVESLRYVLMCLSPRVLCDRGKGSRQRSALSDRSAVGPGSCLQFTLPGADGSLLCFPKSGETAC